MIDRQKLFQFTSFFYFLIIFILNQLLAHYLTYTYFCEVDIAPPLITMLNRYSGSFILSTIFLSLYFYLYYKWKDGIFWALKPLILFFGLIWIFDIVFQLIILLPSHNLFDSCSSISKWTTFASFNQFSWNFSLFKWVTLILTVIWFKWWIPKRLKNGWNPEKIDI